MNRLSTLFLAAILYFAHGANAKSTDREVRGDDAAVRYTGRTQVSDDGSVTFDWVGTYFETKLTGGKLAVRLSDTGTSYYNVFVNGKLHRVVKACGKDTVIDFVSGIGRGIHALRIQKRTEGEFGKTTIHRFILPMSGFLQKEDRQRNRHIEFIGNSLTCGYGTEGKHCDEPFKLETENCDFSFSTIISRYYDADYTLVAHSGRGAVRNYGDTVRVSAVTMREKMLQTFDEGSKELWNFKAYKPDIVIINQGTNDFSVEPKPFKNEFVASYTQILKQLRQHYGQVPILCVYSCTIPAPVYDYFEAVLTEMNDKDIHLLKITEDLFNAETDYGAVWHPNYSGQRKMAMEIIPMVSTLTGWKLSGKAVE